MFSAGPSGEVITETRLEGRVVVRESEETARSVQLDKLPRLDPSPEKEQ
jgi:hypothetical protein